MTKNKTKIQIEPDWWLKSLTGFFLGLFFALALANLIAMWAFHLEVQRDLIPQLAMWSVPWTWMAVFFAVYFVPKGWQAVLIYSLANILAYMAVWVLRG